MNCKMGLAVLASTCLAMPNARANTVLALGVNATDAIGEVFASASNGGEPGHDNQDITQLVGMAPSTTGSFAITDGTYFYTRSTLSTAGLPALTTTGEVYNDAGAAAALPETTIAGVVYIEDTLPLTGGYTYLIAKYDGPNGGGDLWDIAGIAPGTTIDIPYYAVVTGSVADLDPDLADTTTGANKMTSFSLSNPTTTTTSAPDGGATVGLLGLGLVGLSLLRRKLN